MLLRYCGKHMCISSGCALAGERKPRKPRKPQRAAIRVRVRPERVCTDKIRRPGIHHYGYMGQDNFGHFLQKSSGSLVCLLDAKLNVKMLKIRV